MTDALSIMTVGEIKQKSTRSFIMKDNKVGVICEFASIFDRNKVLAKFKKLQSTDIRVSENLGFHQR